MKKIKTYESLFLKIALGFLTLMVLGLFLLQKSAYLNDWIFGLSTLLFIWIGIEHDELVYKEIFSRLFLLSLAVAIIGWGFYYTNPDVEYGLLLVGSKMGLCFLVLQKPLRWFFLKLWKREPEFVGPGFDGTGFYMPKFKVLNFIYSILLMIGTMVLSLSELLLINN